MMLGPTRGGAVRLSEPGETLAIGEGLESCLSAMHATGIPTWAALSTSGLKTLSLPADVRDVIVLADGDDAGECAAHKPRDDGRMKGDGSASRGRRRAWISMTLRVAPLPHGKSHDARRHRINHR